MSKSRPSLSVLLAIKGLVPLEADCTDRIVTNTKDKLIVARTYQGNTDFTRRIELSPNSIKPYEYNEMHFQPMYNKSKNEITFVPNSRNEESTDSKVTEDDFKEKFIENCTHCLGGSYLAKLEAQNLYHFYKKYKEAEQSQKDSKQNEFFRQLTFSLKRMSLWRVIRG